MVFVKNIYEGPMVIDKRVGIDWGVGGAGESKEGKVGTTIIEQQ